MTDELTMDAMASGATEAETDAIENEAWRRVQLARHAQRPRTLDLIPRLFEDFTELHGDRAFGDDPAIVGGPARFDGRPVMVIGHQKGNDTDSNILRNFGSPHPEGFRKAERLMRLADKLRMPIVTFLDTAGAFPGPAAEERGQAEAIASSIKHMTGVRVPTVVVILGEGGSGGALAIGVGDAVIALENAVYSVISPEGCASILWRSPDAAKVAAAAMRMTAADQVRLGTVDEVIAEPRDGAHTDHAGTAKRLKTAIATRIDALRGVDEDLLVATRYARLRSVGMYTEAPIGDEAPREADRTFTDRLGRILHLPGAGRRPRWSDVWPSGDESGDGERGA
jgi:acetyl-CoA carboxylase carboxyl transferase subunit alpha